MLGASVAAGVGAGGFRVGSVRVPVGDEAGVVEDKGVEGPVGGDAGERVFGISIIFSFTPGGSQSWSPWANNQRNDFPL